MAVDLYKTLERLALQLPQYGNCDQAAEVVALIFHAEIRHHPWADTTNTKFKDARTIKLAREYAWNKLSKPRDFANLIRFTIRELQKSARAILVERNIPDDDPCMFGVESFADRGHAEKILEAWDGLAVAPTYAALAKAIEKV